MINIKYFPGAFLLFMIICGIQTGYGQNKYRVYFKDKQGTEFDPVKYFDPKAIERRLINEIPLVDSTDFPVNDHYVSMVSEISDSIGFISRWFNFESVYISSGRQLQKIAALPFVVKIEHVEQPVSVLAGNTQQSEQILLSDTLLQYWQLKRMGGDLLLENHLDGKGIRIAIFDAGFPRVNMHPAFDDIRNEKRIIKTWDFTKNRENVYYSNRHGAMTMACIGGKLTGSRIGLATGAEFLLAKTEVKGEPFAEEEYWLAAAEWADKNGAQIISSSLGYGYQRYFNYQMDGKTSLVVKAANMAARKGILVVNAAGNEGNSDWKYLITPGDGDSVLTVGGINPSTDFHMDYSSFGPTVDKRLKPNVCAFSHVITVTSKGSGPADGTSFATPLVAGFAACILQLNKGIKTMELFRELEKSGHLYPYYDYAHGYGIPQAAYFLKKEAAAPKKTFDILRDENSIQVIALPDVTNSTDWFGSDNLLFYHVSNSLGVLYNYYVIKVNTKNALNLNPRDYQPGDRIMIWYRGYTQTIIL